MTNIGLPGVTLLMAAFGGGDPAAAGVAQLFGAANFAMMFMIAGVH